jgi:hypothetical protein
MTVCAHHFMGTLVVGQEVAPVGSEEARQHMLMCPKKFRPVTRDMGPVEVDLAHHEDVGVAVQQAAEGRRAGLASAENEQQVVGGGLAQITQLRLSNAPLT